MKNPFYFGGIVQGDEFINRESEIQLLCNNFTNSLNTILISPRRWGKTSLVKTAIEKLRKENPDILFCYLDLFKIKNEEQFLESFLQECIKAPSSKMEDALRWSKEVLQKLIPQISFTPSPDHEEFKLKLAWDRKFDPQVILDLPERITKKTNKRLVVCIDEFQNITSFQNSLSFQKTLRAHWQNHRNVAYCLFGSKRHLLSTLFIESPQPFYRFGDLIFLEKIEKNHWIKHIITSFKETGKSIDKKLSEYIISLMNNNPYHVQQLSYYTWLQTEKKCDQNTIHMALDEMLQHNNILFTSIIEQLTESQLGFLQAIANNEAKLSSKSVLDEYKIGTSANASKIKSSLTKREIIDDMGEKLDFEDPLFKIWFKKHAI